MIGNKYLYETHMHTVEGSKCSDTPGRDYIARYRDFGYDGIFITDHFYHGNCAVDRTLPWPDFVHTFCSGYRHAKEEGDKLGFPVFFGWEENFAGDEYLIYGLNEQFMLEHPEMISWTREEQHRAIRAAGGCVVQAHPFRVRNYIEDVWLAPYFVDGIEAINIGNHDMENTLALRYGASLGVPMTAGSDNHHADRMTADNLAGVLLDEPLKSGADYVKVILEHRPIGLYAPHPAPEYTPDMVPDRPVYWLERDGSAVPGKMVAD